jgi:DNA replication protein DnaC
VPELQAALKRIQQQSQSEWEAYQKREAERKQRALNQLREERWKAANLPPRHVKTIPNGPNAATEWWTAYHQANNIVKSRGTVALIGDRGVGKTQIAVELVRSRIILAEHHPWTCIYCRAAELFQEIRECYGQKATRREADVINRFVTPQLLIVDEAHDRAHSDFETRMLTLILDKRYAGLRPTVFIANATPDEFRQQIGESIYDRIVETGAIIHCIWPSYRVVARDARPKGE